MTLLRCRRPRRTYVPGSQRQSRPLRRRAGLHQHLSSWLAQRRRFRRKQHHKFQRCRRRPRNLGRRFQRCRPRPRSLGRRFQRCRPRPRSLGRRFQRFHPRPRSLRRKQHHKFQRCYPRLRLRLGLRGKHGTKHGGRGRAVERVQARPRAAISLSRAAPGSTPARSTARKGPAASLPADSARMCRPLFTRSRSAGSSLLTMVCA